jgi:hypothetical protein
VAGGLSRAGHKPRGAEPHGGTSHTGGGAVGRTCMPGWSR